MENWTIRLKHVPSLANTAWESTDWTTVHQSTANLVSTPSGWIEFPFSTPFIYDGTSHLMVDFSYRNSAPNSTRQGYVQTSSHAQNRSRYHFYRNVGTSYGDPLLWSGTTPSASTITSAPNLRIVRSGSVPVVPATPPVFTAGLWTGSVTFSATSSFPITLQARQDLLFGQSNPFTVITGDTDSDGLPDAWESAHGLDPASTSADHGRLGDPDADGVPNLLEYAFGLDPQLADASAATTCHTAAHPTNGQPHLVFTYRRLLNPGTLTYTVVTSSDLLTWAAPAVAPEVVSTTANPDGVTETVTLRIHPALGTTPSFVRLEVSTP